jgi:hypothetical protein
MIIAGMGDCAMKEACTPCLRLTRAKKSYHHMICSNGSVEDLSSQGYPSASEHTESNPSTIIVSDEETKSYQSIFSGFIQKNDAISSLFRSKQSSSGRQEINKVAKCSSSSISKQSSMRKIDNDFSTSKSQSNINNSKAYLALNLLLLLLPRRV